MADAFHYVLLLQRILPCRVTIDVGGIIAERPHRLRDRLDCFESTFSLACLMDVLDASDSMLLDLTERLSLAKEPVLWLAACRGPRLIL